MKHLIKFAIFIILLNASCTKDCNEGLIYKLNEIKAMGDTLPQKAMEQLDSLRPLFKNEPEYLQNRLSLLDIRLRDKAFIKHTSSISIKELCSYFEKEGTVEDIQEAYYYMGSVYRDLNDYPRAITYFLKSAEIAETKKNIDSSLWENAYSQLSYLYKVQFNYTEALNMSLKQLSVAEATGTINERTYANVASCYFKVNDTLNTVKYYDYILKGKNKITSNNHDILAKAMGDYTVLGYKEEASLCYSLLKENPNKKFPPNYLISLAIYYERFVSADSAAVAMVELYANSNSIESKYDAARWLTRYYTKKGDTDKAAEYAIKFIDANEAVIDKRTLEHTTNAKNFFQYRREKEEEMAIIEKATKARYYLLFGFLTFIIIILAITLHHYIQKKRMLDTIFQKENKIKESKLFIQMKEKEIEEEKKLIIQKEKDLESICIAKSKLAKQLEEAENDFKMLIAQNRELTRLTIMNNISGDAKEIIEKVKKASKGKYHLNDEEWKELLGAIDKLYPEFTYEIQAKFKRISEPVLRVCYLLKIGMSAPQVVNLTGYPRQTVFDRIKRIEKVINIDNIRFSSHTAPQQ